MDDGDTPLIDGAVVVAVTVKFLVTACPAP
jgi:hypothetical protein